jgi:hypothetical protein
MSLSILSGVMTNNLLAKDKEIVENNKKRGKNPAFVHIDEYPFYSTDKVLNGHQILVGSSGKGLTVEKKSKSIEKSLIVS